jgi:DnaK suppressor protein
VAKRASSAKIVAKKAPASRSAKAAVKAAVKPARKAKAKELPAELPLKPIKLKCPLSKKELAEYRAMLLQKRRTLLGDMDGMHAEAMRDSDEGASSDLSTMPVHMADMGTDNYEQEFTLGLLESERQLLRDIDEALQRIADGTYGVCLGTGKPINKSRLRAMPWAKYSIEYARMRERGLGVQGGQEHGGSEAVDDEEIEEDHEEEIEQPEILEESFEPEEDDIGI